MAEKAVIGQSKPYDEDPTAPKGVSRTGYLGHKGYYVDYTYEDGTTETRFFYEGTSPEQGHNGVLVDQGVDVKIRQDYNERLQGPKRTPEAEARDKQIVAEGERKAREAEREDQEKQNNFDQTGKYETNSDRRDREYKERTEARQQAEIERSTKAQEAANQLGQSRLGLDQEKWGVEKNEPKFLSQAGENNPYVVRYNPQSGMMEQIANPNYDRVKVEAERLRQQLATQIQARSVTLDEAKMQYQQWFDSNVKTPLMLAQEARDKAAEQRAALDAEEKRKQFAANFGLQKAELGQRAGAAAMSAEQSLLPYRAGPTEAAEMSSAINSLGAGGTLNGPSASAGINFTPGSFQFDAPDFKKIAKQAAHQALSGLTEYRPAEGSYQTADYSRVPAINTGGAPSIPAGYGQFQDIIDQLKTQYNFGGSSGQ